MCDLMTVLDKSIENRLDEYNTSEIANISRGFDKAGHLNTDLFTTLGRVTERRLDNFKGHELVNTVWGFVTGGYESHTALFTVTVRVVERYMHPHTTTCVSSAVRGPVVKNGRYVFRS